MKRQPCYIRINEEEGYVATTGVNFGVFMEAVAEKPRGLLLLKGYPVNALFDTHTCLEYVPEALMPAFLQEDVYAFGDFCWTDFRTVDDLRKLTDDELAELLFAAHMKRPLRKPFIGCLGNSYLYLSHDDAHWVKIYMQDTKVYKSIIERKICCELMGRKRSMNPIPKEMLDEVYCLLSDGGIFDFEKVSSPSGGVSIYPAKDVEFDADALHMELDRQRNISRSGRYLEYHARTKKWMMW